jgi:hypothetical protein
MRLGLSSFVAGIAWMLCSNVLAQECRPGCRAGYACIDGACVSACNPPCAADELCTADASCATRYEPYEPASVDELAMTQSTFFLHTFAGMGLWGINRGQSQSASSFTQEEPFENLEAVVPSLGAGFGLRAAVNRVIGFRGSVLLASGSDFGPHTGFAAFIDGRFRLGPVAKPFPWFFGVGPVVGLAVFNGTYPNIEDKRGSDSFIRAGFVAETGFAFGDDYDFELGIETRLAAWPLHQQAGVGLVGVGLTIGL